ncbi:MAG: DUF2294 domain-containing protein [Candidatus Omnitrophota bacterium]
MPESTRGQLEARISEAMIKFEKDYMGRGPEEAKTYILEDMVLVRLKGVLTPAEEHLSKSAEGADLIKRTRVQLLEDSRDLLEKLILEITGCPIKSLHTDISTKTGERIVIFILGKASQ